MNFTLFQFKVHNVQVQNKVHNVRTSQLCKLAYRYFC